MAQTGAKVYVGNLSWNTNDDSLRNAFSAFGQILDSIVMRDRDTGRSRGFGFVTYSSPNEAQAAIAGLNEQELDGRRIKVNLANARGAGGGGAPAGSAPVPGYGNPYGAGYPQPVYGQPAPPGNYGGGYQPPYGGQGGGYGGGYPGSGY